MRTGADALQLLEACRSSEALAATVDSVVRQLGVRNWICAIDPAHFGDGARGFVVGGYPSDWVQRYLDQGYLQVDPLIVHARAHSAPLLWRSARRNGLGEDTAARTVARMFDEAREFGIGDGISVPLHGPGLTWGVMSFTANAEDRVDFAEHAPLLNLLAHGVHDAGRRLMRGTRPRAEVCLTARELECLRWAAIGKTSWEIGRLLSVSERTVVFHLQNASSKLGVCSRQAAVVRALAIGLMDRA